MSFIEDLDHYENTVRDLVMTTLRFHTDSLGHQIVLGNGAAILMSRAMAIGAGMACRAMIEGLGYDNKSVYWIECDRLVDNIHHYK